MLSWDSGHLYRNIKAIYIQRQINDLPIGRPLGISIVTSLEIPNTAAFEIAFAAPAHHQLGLSSGWNLISTPVVTPSSVVEIFGVGRGTATTGMIYKWDGFAYEAAFNPEQGYWLFSPHGSTTESFVGLPANGVVEMTSGWNLIGPVTNTPAPVAAGVSSQIW